jgi:hypothetical protein
LPVNTLDLCIKPKPSLRVIVRYVSKLVNFIIILYVLLAVLFLIALLGMAMLWNILCALINPSAFLPYAAGCAAFFTFCVTQITGYSGLFKKGEEEIITQLTKKVNESNIIINIFRKKTSLTIL